MGIITEVVSESFLPASFAIPEKMPATKPAYGFGAVGASDFGAGGAGAWVFILIDCSRPWGSDSLPSFLPHIHFHSSIRIRWMPEAVKSPISVLI